MKRARDDDDDDCELSIDIPLAVRRRVYDESSDSGSSDSVVEVERPPQRHRWCCRCWDCYYGYRERACNCWGCLTDHGDAAFVSIFQRIGLHLWDAPLTRYPRSSHPNLRSTVVVDRTPAMALRKGWNIDYAQLHGEKREQCLEWALAAASPAEAPILQLLSGVAQEWFLPLWTAKPRFPTWSYRGFLVAPSDEADGYAEQLARHLWHLRNTGVAIGYEDTVPSYPQPDFHVPQWDVSLLYAMYDALTRCATKAGQEVDVRLHLCFLMKQIFSGGSCVGLWCSGENKSDLPKCAISTVSVASGLTLGSDDVADGLAAMAYETHNTLVTLILAHYHTDKDGVVTERPQIPYGSNPHLMPPLSPTCFVYSLYATRTQLHIFANFPYVDPDTKLWKLRTVGVATLDAVAEGAARLALLTALFTVRRHAFALKEYLEDLRFPVEFLAAWDDCTCKKCEGARL